MLGTAALSGGPTRLGRAACLPHVPSASDARHWRPAVSGMSPELTVSNSICGVRRLHLLPPRGRSKLKFDIGTDGSALDSSPPSNLMGKGQKAEAELIKPAPPASTTRSCSPTSSSRRDTGMHAAPRSCNSFHSFLQSALHNNSPCPSEVLQKASARGGPGSTVRLASSLDTRIKAL